MDNKHIFMPDLGKVLELDKKSARFTDTVPAGKILVDGYGVGDVGNIVLRDRKHLSQDGLVIVVASVDMHDRVLLSGPDIVSRGFVYVRESEALFENVRKLALDALFDSLDDPRCDRAQIKQHVKDVISKYLYSQTKRKPMVLPIIMYM